MGNVGVFVAPEFKARSGRTLQQGEDGTVTFQGTPGYLAPQAAMDAEELFQAKRDRELGRWRDTLEPHYVAYPVDGGATVQIVDERDGQSHRVTRLVEDTDTGFLGAAYRYFEAHPEPKPWESARPGEVWLVNISDREVAYVAAKHEFNGADEDGRFESFLIVDGGITGARRIWPEDAS